MSIKLKGSSDGSVSLDAPADTSPSGADVTFTLPTADGSAGQVLTTNGSGALSFANEGKILQVVQTVKTDVFSETETSAPAETSDITGLTVSVTPASTSNKVLVSGVISWGTDATSENQISYRLYRGTTRLTTGDASGSTTGVMGGGHLSSGNRSPGLLAFNFLDSPNTTSQVTYSVRFVNQFATTVTLYVNRGGDALDAASRTRGISTITAMEVAG